jgi:hypothetical protein
MDDPEDQCAGTDTAIDIDGLSVNLDRDVQIASLRYFHHTGRFAAVVREAVGKALPEPLRALRVGEAQGVYIVLAWRRPTETLLLCNDRTAFDELERQLAAAADGTMVNLTGGLRAFRVRGSKAGELLLRLGSATAIPSLGEARSGRTAELAVLTVCVQTGEFLLLVERAYAHHLAGWIGVTAADL